MRAAWIGAVLLGVGLALGGSYLRATAFLPPPPQTERLSEGEAIPTFDTYIERARASSASRSNRGGGASGLAMLVGYGEPSEAEMRDALQRLYNYREQRMGSLGAAEIASFQKVACTPAGNLPGWRCEYYEAYSTAVGASGFGQALTDALMGPGSNRRWARFIREGSSWNVVLPQTN